LANNEGRLFPPSKIEQVSETLVRQFQGCRCQPLAPFVGSWKKRGHVYRDNLLLFSVDAPRSDESLNWMLSFKNRLQRQFNQIEIYLAVSELLWL